MTERNEHILIIGIGNEMRGDDAFGIRVVDILIQNHPELGTYCTEQHDLIRLVDQWTGKRIVIIDAIFTENSKAGTIHQAYSFDDLSVEKKKNYSSHSLGLEEVFELSKQLNQLPTSCLFIGVEGENWEVGRPLSDKMAESIPRVISIVQDYVLVASDK